MNSKFPQTEAFLKHIFGNQLELFYDFMTLIITNPKQKLPILYLASEHRSTGKTLFLKYLETFFVNDCAIVSQSALDSQFNSEWADKLIVCVDEFNPSKKETFETLKALATTDKIKVEKRGETTKTIDFYAKLVVATNTEASFDQLRIWTVLVPELKATDPDLFSKLEKEIDSFFDFLRQRELSTKQESRLWFSPNVINQRP